ncbi:hypothetical protein DES45_101927 [Microvirga subterranea]|uniref:Uncharacterized protein n=1 Tax=Microvirga subterranea TaxID=186651 RepID=A0A370HVY0_9HYPH|nr:hypothetical protein DES45_101927 [Microvirga subterranea]
MTGALKHLMGAASLLTVLTGATVAWAQTGRPWVDPPADVGATAKTAPQPSAPSPTPPDHASQPERKTPPTGAPEPRTESASAPQSTPATNQSAATERPSPRKTVDSSKTRRTSARSAVADRSDASVKRKAVASSRTKTAPASRIREAERFDRDGARSARLRDGVNSGLEVMSLRTIEFPDGRRMDVLVRPSPRALSRLMDEAY